MNNNNNNIELLNNKSKKSNQDKYECVFFFYINSLFNTSICGITGYFISNIDVLEYLPPTLFIHF